MRLDLTCGVAMLQNECRKVGRRCFFCCEVIILLVLNYTTPSASDTSRLRRSWRRVQAASSSRAARRYRGSGSTPSYRSALRVRSRAARRSSSAAAGGAGAAGAGAGAGVGVGAAPILRSCIDLVERRLRPDVALHDPDADVCVAQTERVQHVHVKCAPRAHADSAQLQAEADS